MNNFNIDFFDNFSNEVAESGSSEDIKNGRYETLQESQKAEKCKKKVNENKNLSRKVPWWCAHVYYKVTHAAFLGARNANGSYYKLLWNFRKRPGKQLYRIQSSVYHEWFPRIPLQDLN